MNDWILQAAIKLPNGDVYTGKRHDRIIRAIIRTGAYDRLPVGSVQGFSSVRRSFVDRKEALKIAIAAGQAKEGRGSQLYSEDIWPSVEPDELGVL